MSLTDFQQQRVRTKICGITRVEDALAACSAGADAIGFVFYEKSPRAVSIATAQEIIAALPAFVTTVGLFVNARAEFIHAILAECCLDTLQFHGDETAEQCRLYNRPYIKAIRMEDNINFNAVATKYPDTMAFLLDTYVEGKAGGTGKTFDWDQIPVEREKPIILAGGLSSANVGQAIKAVKPWAVDVSGGVEADKGVKDADKIVDFIREVNHAGTNE